MGKLIPFPDRGYWARQPLPDEDPPPVLMYEEPYTKWDGMLDWLRMFPYMVLGRPVPVEPEDDDDPYWEG